MIQELTLKAWRMQLACQQLKASMQCMCQQNGKHCNDNAAYPQCDSFLRTCCSRQHVPLHQKYLMTFSQITNLVTCPNRAGCEWRYLGSASSMPAVQEGAGSFGRGDGDPAELLLLKHCRQVVSASTAQTCLESNWAGQHHKQLRCIL